MFKVLMCDRDLRLMFEKRCSDYLLDFAEDENEILELSLQNSYQLYLANFYYLETFRELMPSQEHSRLIFVDEYYDLFHLKKAFEIADDYLIKPLHFEELKIRMAYQHHKLSADTRKIIKYRDFFFHTNSSQLFHHTQKIKLSPNESTVLHLLLVQIQHPVPKDIILDTLQSSSEGSLRVYISKLNKIGMQISYERANNSYMLNP